MWEIYQVLIDMSSIEMIKDLATAVVRVKKVQPANKQSIAKLEQPMVVDFRASDLVVEGFLGSYLSGSFDCCHLAVCMIEKANSIPNKLIEVGNSSKIGIGDDFIIWPINHTGSHRRANNSCRRQWYTAVKKHSKIACSRKAVGYNFEKSRFYPDMENNNLIESLLYDSSKPLGLLLSERFNEDVHFTHLHPTYMVHFLMGLSSMLMSDHVRSKYGTERVFFTHFGQEKIARLTILTASVHDTPSRKTGWIMSSENKHSISYTLVGKTNTGTTKFFIRSTKNEATSDEIESIPTHVMLIVKEEEMSNMHFPDTYALDEEYVRYNRLNAEDTIVVNIGQEYVHSTQDFLTSDHERDFTRMTEQEFIKIAKSANEEIQTSMWHDKGQFFQFVLSEGDGILDVQFLGREQLSMCANVRLRRSHLHECYTDWDATEATKKLASNQDADESRVIDQILMVKAYKSLVKISQISHYMMLGFMVRDAISDAVNEHYGSAAMDIGFLLASAYSPTLGTLSKTVGNSLLEAGSKFSGYALKTLGYGIQRAISIYVFTDLIKNAVAYGKDTNNTDAGIGMAIDGAFVTIDLLTTAAEAFGAFTFITPVGQIASVLLIVGMNIYETVKKVEQIKQILPLNTGEAIDEILRAFFHMNPEAYIQKLMSEKMVNSKLMQQALDYLSTQSRIDTYITGSAEFRGNAFVMQGDTVIDMRSSFYQRVSRDGTLSFLTTNGQRIRLCVSPNILEKTRIIFNDGSVINLNNSLLLSVTLSTDHTIQQIEHMYSDALERLGVLMVAYSISDDESVTISHGKIQESKSSVTSQILHSSVDHSTHMMLNGGQYLILINTNTHGKIEDTTIKSRNAKNLTKVIIDLSGLIEFYTGDDSSFIQVHAYLWNRSNLNVEVNLEKSDGLVLLGNIVIQDVLRDDLYSKVSIRNYGELNINLRNRAQNYYRVENAADQYEITMFDGETNILSPSPIKFGNLTDVILLTPYNVEPFNEIIIDSVIQFDSFSINATSLVLTSLGYNYLNNGGKIFTMFLEGFYTVNKMETLSLRLGDQLIQLKEYKRSIAADFSDWWMSTQKMINRG
uniref:Uncharacterized protein n=1 Tax=Romanomermis culicivorax TaxID=13658 RepID=A0A915K4I3_ROMCU